MASSGTTRPRAAQQRAEQAERRAAAVRLERGRLVTMWVMVFASLAWIPGGFTRFVFAKLLLVAIACALGATLRRDGRLPRALTWALAVGAGLFVLAALVGQTPVASLVGRWPRYEGLPVLGLYAGSSWLGARIVGRGTVHLVHLAHALSAMSLVLVVFSLLDEVGHSPLVASNLARSGSLLGNATDQGLVALMATAVIAGALVRRADSLLLAGVAASVTTVGLSGSRTAMALTVVALVGVAVPALGTGAQGMARRRALTAAAGLVVAMALVAALVPSTRHRLFTAGSGRARLTQWRLTLHLVADHPWLGIGPSRYVDAFGRYESPAFVRFTGPHTFADSPHDILLQTMVAGGVPLLGCLLALVGLSIRRATRVLREHPEALGLVVAVAAYGLAMLVNFTIAGSTCLAAFLAGAVLAEPTGVAESAWRRRSGAGVFAVAAVVMAMSCVAEVLLAHGVAAAQHGDPSAARSDVDAAHRWRPLDADVPMLGAQALAGLTSRGKASAAPAAAALANESLDRTPDTYSAQVALGVALIAEHKLPAAQDELNHAVELFPRRPDAYVQRAIARYGLHDVAGARDDLRQAAEIEPQSTTVRRLERLIGSSADGS